MEISKITPDFDDRKRAIVSVETYQEFWKQVCKASVACQTTTDLSDWCQE